MSIGKYKNNTIVCFYRESVCYTGWVNNVYSYAEGKIEYTIQVIKPVMLIMHIAEKDIFIAGDMEHEFDRMAMI